MLFPSMYIALPFGITMLSRLQHEKEDVLDKHLRELCRLARVRCQRYRHGVIQRQPPLGGYAIAVLRRSPTALASHVVVGGT